jgi:protein-L-isoaspartate O-methyltransferase
MRSRCCWAAVPRRRRGRLAAGRPYDCIHVTCGITRIPCTWVTQCRPGALIVLPWLPTGYAGHWLRLHVGADGRAIGRFHAAAAT